jgi:hypothetical protein
MRTDIHKPSSITPADYAFVAFDYIKINDLGDCFVITAERGKKAAHFASTGGAYSTHEHGGVCMICGNANALYTCTFYHQKSNSYLRTGQDCAQKLDLATGDFNAFRTRVGNHLEAVAGKRKAQAFLESVGLSTAWEIATITVPALYAANQARFDQDNQNVNPSRHIPIPFEETTITDIVSKLVKYGSISDKQVAFLGRLLTAIPKRAALNVQRAAEKAAASDAPPREGHCDRNGSQG